MSARKPGRITADEAAHITGLSVRAVQDMALRGDIPGAAKLGKRWTFDAGEIEAWIKTQVQATKDRAESARAPRKTATSSGGPARPMRAFKSTEAGSREAYERAIGRRRKSA